MPVRTPLGAGRFFADFAPGVGEHAQGARRGDRRVELAQTAGGGIARVGEHFLAGGFLALVECGEFILCFHCSN